MIKVAVIGGSGYTGAELIRLLSLHPKIKITAVTSEQSAGKPIGQVFPSLQRLPLTFEPMNIHSISSKADFFFIALPSGSAMDPAAELVAKDKKVVDLSADYRLRRGGDYETWYQQPHRHLSLLKKAVYGLPEVHREKIRKARLVANPGCYPVSVILALLPLLQQGVAELQQPIIIDSKSGVSGAGRSPGLAYHFPEIQEGLTAYGLRGHRHLPEMAQELTAAAGGPVRLIFTPHLVPMNRGILSSIYVRLKKDPLQAESYMTLYRDFYKTEPFIQILEPGVSPNPHHVRGSNLCQISITVDSQTKTAVLLAAIDNLVKGAAGQAIQNMNLMMDMEETTGLESIGLFP